MSSVCFVPCRSRNGVSESWIASYVLVALVLRSDVLRMRVLSCVYVFVWVAQGICAAGSVHRPYQIKLSPYCLDCLLSDFDLGSKETLILCDSAMGSKWLNCLCWYHMFQCALEGL